MTIGDAFDLHKEAVEELSLQVLKHPIYRGHVEPCSVVLKQLDIASPCDLDPPRRLVLTFPAERPFEGRLESL